MGATLRGSLGIGGGRCGVRVLRELLLMTEAKELYFALLGGIFPFPSNSRAWGIHGAAEQSQLFSPGRFSMSDNPAVHPLARGVPLGKPGPEADG